MDQPRIIKDARLQKLIERRSGQVAVFVLDTPSLLYIQVAGYVGPSMLQEVLTTADAFGRQHGRGWEYIVDTTRLGIANPLNIFWLRRVHNLPNLDKYIVIMPILFPNSLLVPLLSWFVKPDCIFDSVSAFDQHYGTGRQTD